MAATIGNTARLLIWGGFGGLQCISVSAVLYPSFFSPVGGSFAFDRYL